MSAGGDERVGGRLALRLLGLVLPAGRRDEFIGDLLEEAHARERRHGRAAARQWLWHQVLASLPSLIVARARRTPLRSLAVAVPAGPRGLDAVVSGARPSGGSLRKGALSVSVLLHAVVVLGALVYGLWGVDELSPPRVVITFWNRFPAPAPAFAEPAPAAATPARSDRTTARTPARPRPVDRTAPVSPPLARPGGDPGTSVSLVDGSGSGDLPCGAGGGAVCAPMAPEPPPLVPPRVAEKSCASCPLPRLPPAFQRVGMRQDLLARICVGADGAVTSVLILRGIGGAADDAVRATLATWRFTPYTLDGRPVPFCYVSRFVFTTE